MITNKDTILVYIPFKSSITNRLSHCRALVRIVNNPNIQMENIPSWAIILAEYLAKKFKPGDIPPEGAWPITSTEVARYYFQHYAREQI